MQREFFGVGEIKLKTACDVQIVGCTGTGKAIVEIEATEEQLKDFEVRQDGDTVAIVQKSTSTRGMIIGDVIMGGSFQGVISTGRGTTVINRGGNTYISGGSGKIFVNGQEIDLNAGAGGESVKPPTIKILATSGLNLSAELYSGKLTTRVPFNGAEIDYQGHVEAEIAAVDLDANISDSGILRAAILGGDLDVTIAGSAQVFVTGKWSKAGVNISGSGSVNSSGECLGNYSATVSGSGRVVHTGIVGGRVKERVSGSGRVQIG